MKLIIKPLLYLIGTLFIFSCQDKHIQPEICCTNYDVGIDISVKSKEGIDLLDKNVLGNYNVDNIKLFYLIDGKKTEVFDASQDYPRNLFLVEYPNEYRLRVFANYRRDQIEDDKSTLYIHWNNTDIDTIECNYSIVPNSLVVTKVLLNKVKIWDLAENNDNRFVDIIK